MDLKRDLKVNLDRKKIKSSKKLVSFLIFKMLYYINELPKDGYEINFYI